MLIGKGILDWPESERVSNRYGNINLFDNNDNYIKFEKTLNGWEGTLFAVVTETRASGHIGDLFRGLFPETPNINEKIILGTGTIFFENNYNCIGLKPDDGRDSDWFDPKSLYRCHEQAVELYFEPKAKTEFAEYNYGGI